MTPRPRAPLSADYFSRLSQALHRAGIGEPVLVIDDDRLSDNLKLLTQLLPSPLAYRIVAKSLPSAPLLERVARQCRTDRLMSFNTHMLRQVLEQFPTGDHLMGKPVTLTALDNFYTRLPRRLRAGGQKIHWLADTADRLQALALYAAQKRRPLNIGLEIDIGLHRGGFETNLAPALSLLAQSKWLTLTAIMGYEPHLAKLPNLHNWRRHAQTNSRRAYRSAMAQIDGHLGAGTADRLIRNIGGSGTFRLYRDAQMANEVAAGSVLVKPSDFDLPSLSGFKPASFIATPILKALNTIRLPAHEQATELLGDPEAGQMIFTHGGYWMADPVFPKGLGYHDLYGRSSNQEMMTYRGKPRLTVDDHVFLRPRQSEAVFLQFPNWAIYRKGKIDAVWAPFSPSV